MEDFLASILPLLFILAVAVLASKFTSMANRSTDRARDQMLRELGIDPKKESKCPPHAWSHRESDNKLQCTRYACQMVAGETKHDKLFS